MEAQRGQETSPGPRTTHSVGHDWNSVYPLCLLNHRERERIEVEETEFSGQRFRKGNHLTQT